ncbi:protein-tyrosine-phosphatase [Marinobacter szutsaonensis]
MFNDILIVCVGNICRSPMAEYLLRARLHEQSGKQIHSAGIGALVDKPADETALELLKEQGIDATGHRARQVTQKMLASADLILAMEEGHLKRLHEIAPQIRGRAFLLGKWQNSQPVPDPYRQQRPAFEHAFKLIDRATESWLKYLGN